MIYAPFTWSSRTIVTIGWVFYTWLSFWLLKLVPFNSTHIDFLQVFCIFLYSHQSCHEYGKNQGFSTQSDYGALWVNMFLINPQKVKKTKNIKNKNAFRQEKYHFPALKLDFSKQQILQWLWGYKTSLVNNYHFIPRFITWITGISIP